MNCKCRDKINILTQGKFINFIDWVILNLILVSKGWEIRLWRNSISLAISSLVPSITSTISGIIGLSLKTTFNLCFRRKWMQVSLRIGYKKNKISWQEWVILKLSKLIMLESVITVFMKFKSISLKMIQSLTLRMYVLMII